MIHGWRVFICKMNKVENSSTKIFLDENSIQVTHTHIYIYEKVSMKMT